MVAGCGPLMRLVDWIMSFRTMQQFFVLYKKNALVAWRNRKATILRLIAPFLFLVLALLIDKALQANDKNSTSFKDVTNPQPEAVSRIPQCSEDLYIGTKPCTEILYSPDNSITRAIMGNVTARNSVPILATPYPSQDAIQEYLLANPDAALAAVHFVYDNLTAVPNTLNGFLLQTNTTTKFFKGNYQNPNLFIQIPLQSAVHREIARYFMAPANSVAAASLSWNVGVAVFAHPAVATVSVLGQVLGPFVFAACMFSFVSQIGFLVSEKELGLRQALRTMGMTDAAYWLSWAAWELTLAFISGHLIAIYGLILQFQLFLDNNYGLLFFLFFLFQLSMSSLAMFVCSFIKKTQIAVYIGFGIFLIGWIMQTVVIFGVPYTPDFYKDAGGIITIIFSAFPWDLLAKGFQDLGSATVSSSSPGIRWSERSSYCQNIPNTEDQPNYDPKTTYINFKCVMPLALTYWVYVALWLGYFVLAIYVDNVLPNEFGVRKPFYYFLMPSYWFPSLATGNKLKDINDSMGPACPPESVDDDVAAEEAKCRSLLVHRTGHGGDKLEMAALGTTRNAVEIYGLKKVFPHNPCGACGSCFFCCSSDKDSRAFWAIKGSWFGIAENQLFCLLGPNGAGKSTTINCLTGVLPPSNGEALVYGQPISCNGSMDRIRSMMGVCPQFDVLWGELSGIEHLNIYGHVKGVYWADVGKQAATLLERVKLTYAGQQRSSAYSGGMKRRLSVAIALLGDPKIVYLDEPTTGMDPISRRYVWDIIQEAKVGRAIVLTTHSMEEADILGDRIAIMAKGRLRCLGTSLRLKQKFGSGYQVAVSVIPSNQGVHPDPELIAKRTAAIKAFFQQHLGLAPFEEGRVYLSYLIPRDKDAQLMPFLKQLEANADALGMTDLQLSLTSLEEVFLNIAKTAELEEAKVRNAKPLDVLLPDGTALSVPLGEEYVVNPLTSQTYKVRWGTDESGNLCVLECKPVDASQLSAAPSQAIGALTYAPPVAMPPASISGTSADITLPDGSVLRVPLLQRYVLNPMTNQPYEISWGQDAAGAPLVTGCVRYVEGGPAAAPAPAMGEPGTPASFFNLETAPVSLPGTVNSSLPTTPPSKQ